MEEIWKSCPSYPGYQASSYGRIRSLDMKFTKADGKIFIRKGRVRRQMCCKGRKYFTVQVFINRKARGVFSHRIICDAFIGPIPSGFEVNHIDMDTFNNRPENLEYVTHRENNIKRFIGKKRGAKKQRNKWYAEYWDGQAGKPVYIKGGFPTKEEAYNCYYEYYFKANGFYPW